jgi:predicted restriction endonuclease
LDGVAGDVPQARGSGLGRWLSSQEARGGLLTAAYDLMATDSVLRQKVVSALLDRFFPGEDSTPLLREVQLAGPIFNGYGEVPHISVGQLFKNRQALATAKVHRPGQAGICGTPKLGAESIVVSGGYEDDEDYGRLIIYTGQGGRDDRTGQQVRDQELVRGNAALVTSLTTGAPVRVVRGAGGDPQHSPATGLRYDGLFRVEDYWSEVGRSGYLVWRYRLSEFSSVQIPQTPSLPIPRQPEGRETPPRATSTTQRIVRSTAVADYVKRIHDYACQICGTRLATPTGAYAEAAHIRPLGRPHNGPDVAANVLCLCPNHHVLFDFGMLSVAEDFAVTDRATGAGLGRLREVAAHQIDGEQIAYHRAHHARSGQATAA